VVTDEEFSAYREIESQVAPVRRTVRAASCLAAAIVAIVIVGVTLLFAAGWIVRLLTGSVPRPESVLAALALVAVGAVLMIRIIRGRSDGSPPRRYRDR